MRPSSVSALPADVLLGRGWRLLTSSCRVPHTHTHTRHRTMPELEVEMQAATIVLVGAFNPAIFQPSWFGARELIPKKEAEAADVNVIHAGISSFSLEWLAVEVTSDRFQATANDPGHFPLLRDFVCGSFRVLQHTPCTALGLNCTFHARLQDHEVWHRLGDRLAPKEIWNRILEPKAKKLDRASTGLLSLSILGNRPGAQCDGVTINIAPSSKIRDGIFLTSNEHYPIETGSVLDAVRLVMENWVSAVAFSETVLRQLVAEGIK